MQYEKALRIAQHSINASETFEFSGRWRNRHATILELKTKGPELDGLCRVAEAGFVHTGEKTAVIKGFVMGDLIGFTALWEHSQSITQWCGQILGAETPHPKLVLMWRLITELPEPEEPRYFWMSTFAGTDDFVRFYE